MWLFSLPQTVSTPKIVDIRLCTYVVPLNDHRFVDGLCLFFTTFFIFFCVHVRNVLQNFTFCRGVYLSHRLRLDVNWKVAKKKKSQFSSSL